MALPKHRKSKARRDTRRTHQKTIPQLTTTCPQCGESRLSHHMCKHCGAYKGRTVLDMSKD